MSDAPQKPDHAAPFDSMAAKVRHNAENGFAGAFVIVPPVSDMASDPVEVLFLDASPNPAAFWGQIKARIDIVLVEIEERQRRQQGFGR